MSKNTGELIIKKSINLCCQPIFSYISSLVIVRNAPFSQSLSHFFINITQRRKGMVISIHTLMVPKVCLVLFCFVVFLLKYWKSYSHYEFPVVLHYIRSHTQISDNGFKESWSLQA